MTQDGRLARRLLGNRDDREVWKRYVVDVEWGGMRSASELSEAAQRLQAGGMELDGRVLLPAEVEWVGPQTLQFGLLEGAHRQIRRMCELVGLRVARLRRVAIGSVDLGGLGTGCWRTLGAGEVEQLMGSEGSGA